jgi:hypothetical protein
MWWCGGGLALAVAFIVAQAMQSTIAGYGKLMPIQMAILQNKDGLVSFSVINFLTGRQDDLCIVQIERGEMLRLHMSSPTVDQTTMCKNDTIASMSSSATNEQLALLHGELGVALSKLEAERSGEKPEVINAYRNRMELARTKMEAKERSHLRLTELFKKDLTSEDLYDISANELQVMRLQTKAAQCDLDAIKTGVKPSMERMLQSQITALQEQMNVLNEHKDRLSLLAPFNGRLSTFIASDTLLTISDLSRGVLLLPVRLADMEAVRPGAVVRCRLSAGVRELEATVCRVKRDIFYFHSQPMVTAVAVLQQPVVNLPDGAVCKYKISSRPYLQRLLSDGSFLGDLF